MMRFLIFLSILFAWAAPAFAADIKIAGKYEAVGPLEKLKGIKQIEMVEFFNFSCGHCNAFLKTSKRLHDKFKDKLFHKKYPIYWESQTPFPAMAFYVADELGMQEKVTQELFDTNFKLQINVFQIKVINHLAKEWGIEKEMTEGLQSKKIEAKVKKYMEVAHRFNANETPTIIINDTLKVTPRIAGGSVEDMTDNLEVIFQDLLKGK